MQSRDKEKLKLIYEKFPSQMSQAELCYATEEKRVHQNYFFPLEAIKRVKSITIKTDCLSSTEKKELWKMLSEINQVNMTSTSWNIYISGSTNVIKDRNFLAALEHELRLLTGTQEKSNTLYQHTQ